MARSESSLTIAARNSARSSRRPAGSDWEPPRYTARLTPAIPPRPARQALGDGPGAIHELLTADDLVDQPELVRRLRLERRPRGRAAVPGRSEHAREPLSAATPGRKAEQDLRLADQIRPRRHQPDVAGERQLAAAAHRRAVDRRDEHRARAVEAQQHLAEALGGVEAGGGRSRERLRSPGRRRRAPTAVSEARAVARPTLGDAREAASSSATS